MTVAVYLVRLPSPTPAQASELVANEQGEGLRAVDAAAEAEVADTVVEPVGPNLPGTSAATAGRYRLRVGVFTILSNAVEYAEVLRADGYRPEVIPRRNSRQEDLYYLYVASYDDPDEATREADRLRAAGRDVYVEEGDLTAR